MSFPQFLQISARSTATIGPPTPPSRAQENRNQFTPASSRLKRGPLQYRRRGNKTPDRASFEYRSPAGELQAHAWFRSRRRRCPINPVLYLVGHRIRRLTLSTLTEPATGTLPPHHPDEQGPDSYQTITAHSRRGPFRPRVNRKANHHRPCSTHLPGVPRLCIRRDQRDLGRHALISG